MDLVGALRNQEKAAGDQNDVAAGDRVTKYLEQRRGQADDPRERKE